MKIYNTYQEAKIANPDSGITRIACSWGGGRKYTGKFMTNNSGVVANGGVSYEICDPSDYCMTLEEFIDKGYEIKNGDVVLANDKQVYYADVHLIVLWKDEYDKFDDFYILRAAALEQVKTPEEKEAFDVMAQDNEVAQAKSVTECKYNAKIAISGDVGVGKSNVMYEIATMMRERFGVIVESRDLQQEIGLSDLSKIENWQLDSIRNTKWEITESTTTKKPKPKHTKVEYVKVEYDHAWQAVKDFEDGDKFYTYFQVEGWVVIDNAQQVVQNFQAEKIYRKVLRELTEREAFVEEVEKIVEYITQDEWSSACLANEMFDSGKFKLVDGE